MIPWGNIQNIKYKSCPRCYGSGGSPGCPCNLCDGTGSLRFDLSNPSDAAEYIKFLEQEVERKK